MVPAAYHGVSSRVGLSTTSLSQSRRTGAIGTRSRHFPKSTRAFAAERGRLLSQLPGLGWRGQNVRMKPVTTNAQDEAEQERAIAPLPRDTSRGRGISGT